MIHSHGAHAPHRGSAYSCLLLPGYDAKAPERVAVRAALPRDGFPRCGVDRLDIIPWNDSCCVRGRMSENLLCQSFSSGGHEPHSGSFSVKASSDEGSQDDRLEEFSRKSAISGKKKKFGKVKVSSKDEKKKLLNELRNVQGSHVKVETSEQKSNVAVSALQLEEDLNESWTDEEKHSLVPVLNRLEALHLHALASEQWLGSWLMNIHRKYQRSAQNLLHYIAVKSVDLKEVESSLPILGLPGFEGAEGHILASLNQNIAAARTLSMSLASEMDPVLEKYVEKSKPFKKEIEAINIREPTFNSRTASLSALSPMSISRSALQLSQNCSALFGPQTSSRKTHIMVTISEEVLENDAIILDLMKAGMDVARINCAHGDPEIWGRIIQSIRHSSQMLERPCRVLMDIAGPKLRTSAFPPGPRVQKIKPHRDSLGKVILPARVWIALPGTPVPDGMPADAIVPVEGAAWLGSLQVGDKLRLRDGRGKEREMIISDKVMGLQGIGCWAECFKTTYVESGAKFKHSNKKGKLFSGYIGDLPPVDCFIRLKKGDKLVLTKENSLQSASMPELNESSIYKIKVSHTFGQLFGCVKPGELIKFDDGKIEGIVRGITSSEICVEVTFANEKGTKLSGEKSVNLPNNDLSQRGLTVKDLVDLDFVIAHADMVALSFVNNAQDVQALQQVLKTKGATSIGIIFKIETRSGVMKLPEILLQGMKSENPLGVMIARGDLAVECGWESLHGVQEEIMSISKAAHVPTIWATQVLESLTKDGLPTRPEITDAALGARAACVMLNKGSYVLKAVSVLNSILDSSITPWWKRHSINQQFGISGLVDLAAIKD